MCIRDRLKELSNLKNSSSAVKRSRAVGERMQRLVVAVCEQSRDCVRFQEQLQEMYGDVLKYRGLSYSSKSVSYTHLRAHETVLDLVCRLLLEKKKNINKEMK
eukprot:TRINITY_DN30067_c0_g1_i1.p1 TRINITY_DN30067_c0_g1~~TRINITY_DN30067_c0_g1_i1.p1  ORF type:complete len:103 (+),score=47.25 TRINITY_DN30067_c0_g1_i1:89-397(+)